MPARFLRHRYRTLAALAAAVAAVVVVVVVALAQTPQRPPAPADGANPLHARFETLAAAHSNSCGLQRNGLMRMPPGMRLQGSCCTAMDYGSYVAQRRGLRPYARLGVVPRDPYDVPVGLARTLVGYDAIALNSAQQRVYARAAATAHEKGPCCCRCWRWTAFEGQAKYLITHKHFRAPAVARLWDLEDGCGGAPDSGTRS